MGARTTQSFRLRWGSAKPGWREKEKERDKDWEDRTRERERKRVRERGGKSPTSLPGVCKHLPRGLLLPQPSLSGFVKALGALIPGCRMRRIEQRARSWHTHARDLFAYPRPLNLFFLCLRLVAKEPRGEIRGMAENQGANVFTDQLSILLIC